MSGAPSSPAEEARARVSISREPLSVDAVIAQVKRPEAGAIGLFLGAVRDHNEGAAVTALEYEAYESMAIAEMARIVAELEEEIAEVRLAVAHRIGRLEIGDIAIICAASSPHRAESFVAGRALIDRIKERVPIWKRERGADGARWVNWEDARIPPPEARASDRGPAEGAAEGEEPGSD